MYKKFMAFLLAVMMMASMAACGNGSTDNGGNKSADNGNTEPEQTEAVEAEHYKKYKFENGENHYIYITVWYREGSNEVARINGSMKVPSSNPSYEELKAEGYSIEEKVKAANKPEDIMSFSIGEIEGDESVINVGYNFNELDASNADSVGLAAELLGMPLTDGKLLVDKCDEFLIGIGMTKTSDL